MGCRTETGRRALLRGHLLTSVALGFIVASGIAAPARADGGKGGDPVAGGTGGAAGGAGYAGAPGADGTNFGGGGGGAAGGGAGGAGDGNTPIGGRPGGAGGTAASPNGGAGVSGPGDFFSDVWSSAGGGGGGFNGDGTVAAGKGGDGGNGGRRYTADDSITRNVSVTGIGTGGGGGGAGGAGREFSAPATIYTNAVTLQGGGAGGNGGVGGAAQVSSASGADFTSSSTATGGVGGAGGSGGAGLLFSGTGASFTNQGTGVVRGTVGGTGGIGGGAGAQANANRGAGTALAFGGNGGAGGTGGAGVVFSNSAAMLRNDGAIVGGAGGTGGQASGLIQAAVSTSGPRVLTNTLGTGGVGGDGGVGVVLTGAAGQAVNAGTITGGAGGIGGAATSNNNGGRGGNGGAGGAGVQISAGGGIVISGQVRGGQGGNAGLPNGTSTSNGGSGGTGGVGVQGQDSTVTVASTGVIQGGQGGRLTQGNASAGVDGSGGVGVTGGNIAVFNAGTIAGGTSWFLTRNDAIRFTGGVNSLTIASTSVITGRVLAFSAADTFALGGDTNGTFNNSAIGAQYQGFGLFEKTGNSTWTLTGTTTEVRPWTISQGTLSISQDANLGAVAGGLTFNGGTLATTASFTTSRNITLSAGGGTFALAANTTLGITSIISGGGSLTMVGAGTLILSGANNYTGLTTVSAGTLALTDSGRILGGVSNAATFTSAGQVSGGLTNTGTVTATAGSIDGAIANNAGTVSVTGTVTSNSTFTNASGATLAIGAAGNYTLQGKLTNSGTITVAGGGQLTATAGGITNTGSIEVAAGATVRDDLDNSGPVTNNGNYFANVASNSGTITNDTAGTWTGNVLGNAGTIVNNGTWSGNVIASAGTLTNNSVWTGSITTSGGFTNSAGGTVSGLVANSGTLINAGALNGGLTNSAGTTVNNGSIGGLTTLSGGMLSGTGSVVDLNVTGGTFAPGNGTPGSSMTVSGALTMASAATYRVDLNPQTASAASVGGLATLGGATVDAVYTNGQYIERQYTILTATGGINGTFGGLTDANLPQNFTAALGYDANHAYLNLTLVFAPVGLNRNQQAVADTLTDYFNNTGGIPGAFGTLSPAGLTAVSGEVATRTQQTTFNAMDLFLSLLTDPTIAGRGGSPAVQASVGGGPALAYADETGAPSTQAFASVAFEPRWTIWTAGFGGSQTSDGNAALGSNAARSDIYGAAFGGDYWLSPDTVAGFAVAGGGTSFSVDSGGSGSSDLFQAGAFFRHNAGPAYVTGALAYGWQDITTSRSIGVDRLQARFDANAVSGRLEGGYRVATPLMGLTPYAAGEFTHFDLPAYAEKAISGADTFALRYGAKDVTAARSEIGLRADRSWQLDDAVLTLRGRAAWAHNFDPDRNISAAFQTLPGTSFVVGGAAEARDAALTTLSAEMNWRQGLSIAATFEGEFSGTSRSYAGKGVLRYEW